jgi:hypothetical protein
MWVDILLDFDLECPFSRSNWLEMGVLGIFHRELPIIISIASGRTLIVDHRWVYFLQNIKCRTTYRCVRQNSNKIAFNAN